MIVGLGAHILWSPLASTLTDSMLMLKPLIRLRRPIYAIAAASARFATENRPKGIARGLLCVTADSQPGWPVTASRNSLEGSLPRIPTISRSTGLVR